MNIAKPLWFVILALCTLFMVGPLVLVVIFSFGKSALIGFPMGGVTLAWYRELLANDGFRASLMTSLVVAGGVAVISTITGTMAAFALTRAPDALARPVLALVSLPILLPPLVIAIAIVVLVVRGLGLSLGLPIVILGHVLVTQPFVALIVMARLAAFGPESVEAARDLGATRWQAFRLVTLPQISTAIIGATLIAASISLDDFIIASFTIGGGNTLSTFVWGKLRTTLDPSVNAIATILLALTIGMAMLALRLARYRG